MAHETVATRVEIDEAADFDLKRWARAEGKSKRRHIAILCRKLTALTKTNAEDLVRLGLMDGHARPMLAR